VIFSTVLECSPRNLAVDLRKLVPVDRIRYWASQLAGETRDPDSLRYSYVVPDVLESMAREFASGRRGLFGLVGQQGVGKSTALKALFAGIPFSLDSSRVIFKWRNEKELFSSLLNFTHEATDEFLPRYLSALFGELQSCSDTMNGADFYRFLEFQEGVQRYVVDRLMQIEKGISGILWAERMIGKAATEKLRRDTWLKTLLSSHVILIDTSDYSKTDKRRMDSDFEGIYWFWNNLVGAGSTATIVVAIQKEMFRDHYFLDKMRQFELRPMNPEKMVDAYRLEFETTYPFSEDALLTLARMSRGIFRRFLRYIQLTLDFWERPDRSQEIDTETVKKSVPLDRLAEDMELEFHGLFPKHSELRTLAVQVIMYLQENGPQKQSELISQFDVDGWAMSRLLGKLESRKHVVRRRDGTDKIVFLTTHSGTAKLTSSTDARIASEATT